MGGFDQRCRVGMKQRRRSTNGGSQMSTSEVEVGHSRLAARPNAGPALGDELRLPWTARSDTQNRPLRTDLTLDAATGRLLSQSHFHDKPALDQAVDYGVAAHEGHLFGLANQLLNLTMAIGLITLSISGFLMWRKRKPADALGAPPRLQGPRVATAFVGAVVVLGIILPMFALSLIIVLLTERLLLRRLEGPTRWLGLTPA